MFILVANKNQLSVRQSEPITSGSVNIYLVRFAFSADWDGLVRTAIFKAGNAFQTVSLDDTGECSIPQEVLMEPGVHLMAGVYGMQGEETVLPTVFVSLGTILSGAASHEKLQNPIPPSWEKFLAAKGDTLSYDGLNLSLLSGDKSLSTVQIAGGGGTGTPVPGPEGPQGKPGKGVPAGGTTDQILAKVSGADYDTKWIDPPSPGVNGPTYTSGDGVTIQDDAISVTTPVRSVLTQAEYDGLPEELQAKGLYVISDEGPSSLLGVAIHEYDTDDGWHVRKWSSGYVEQIYRTPFTIEASEWNTWSGTSVVNFTCELHRTLPVPLQEKYSETFGYYGLSTGGNGLEYMCGGKAPVDPLTETNIYWPIRDAKPPVTYSGYMSLHVAGRWK